MWAIRVPLETVTPLFLGGSEPWGSPELRATSFRGAMRFWFRALAGAHLESIKDVRSEEARVFGDAGKVGGSPVVVRLTGNPRAGRFEGAQGPGARYLFFSLAQRERDHTGRTMLMWRDCFPPGTRLEVSLQLRSPVSGRDHEILARRTAAAFWLLVRLGGLGARSRRGAGGLRATADPTGWPTELPGLVVHARDPSALKDELEVGLRMLGEAVAIPAAERGPIRPTFNVLRRGVCDIAVLDRTWQTWEQALEAVGTALQSFRNRREPDYSNVKGVVGGRSPRLQTVERAAFGLPIVFYFRSLGGASGTLQGDKSDRRASPLWIRVVRLTAGGYAVVLTVFRAPLLQDREPLKLKTRGRPALAPAPGLALIDDFLRALSTPGGLHYVAPLLEVDYP